MTTVSDNCWMVLISRSAQAATASTNATFVIKAGGGTDPSDHAVYDTNSAQTPAGSKSMNLTFTSSASVCATAMMSFAPSAAPASKGNFLAFM